MMKQETRTKLYVAITIDKYRKSVEKIVKEDSHLKVGSNVDYSEFRLDSIRYEQCGKLNRLQKARHQRRGQMDALFPSNLVSPLSQRNIRCHRFSHPNLHPSPILKITFLPPLTREASYDPDS